MVVPVDIKEDHWRWIYHRSAFTHRVGAEAKMYSLTGIGGWEWCVNCISHWFLVWRDSRIFLFGSPHVGDLPAQSWLIVSHNGEMHKPAQTLVYNMNAHWTLTTVTWENPIEICLLQERWIMLKLVVLVMKGFSCCTKWIYSFWHQISKCRHMMLALINSYFNNHEKNCWQKLKISHMPVKAKLTGHS